MINVTKTYLPPLEEYVKKLEGIWQRGWITNHGPLVNELETELKRYLGVKHLFFVSNGTIALQIAIKALGLKEEVITTPFSYVATTSSIVWENCKPVFADINPSTLTIDPEEVEKKITRKTTGIVGVHVYGNPCEVEKIQKVAKKYNLKVIYDAAHAFGVKYKDRSILNYGDISTLSFHATKLFHTVEGGAVITNNDKLASKISYMRNFGHVGKEKPESYFGLGINGKNSEIHAVMGLCILPKIAEIIESRKQTSLLYDKLLKNTGLLKQKIKKEVQYNYAYYPIIFPSEKRLVKVQNRMIKHGVCPRRYFYPSLNKLNYITCQPTKISENISSRILCLPLYYGMSANEVSLISELIKIN